MPKVQAQSLPTVRQTPLQVPYQRLDSRGAFGEALPQGMQVVASEMERVRNEDDLAPIPVRLPIETGRKGKRDPGIFLAAGCPPDP